MVVINLLCFYSLAVTLSALLRLSAVFCPFTHTQTRASHSREWLEDEWSGINGGVTLVFTTFTQPFLTGVILENVKM